MAQVVDRVCKMTIDSETGAGKSEYKGQTYYFYFYAPGRKEAFDADPEK